MSKLLGELQYKLSVLRTAENQLRKDISAVEEAIKELTDGYKARQDLRHEKDRNTELRGLVNQLMNERVPKETGPILKTSTAPYRGYRGTNGAWVIDDMPPWLPDQISINEEGQ